jgi:glycosyltransferase involved in cell wall biosynthesis
VAFSIDNMQVGGTELNAVRTAENLDRSRFELMVISLQTHGPLRSRYAELGVPVHPFPIRSLASAGTVSAGMRLARFLRQQRVQVFHAHDIYSNIFGVPWARLAGIRTVLASRRWWNGPARHSLQAANRMSYAFAHRVIANGPRLADLLATQGVGRHRVAIVPNFVDDSAFLPTDLELRSRKLREFGIPEASPVVGMVANLHPVKDQPTLLHATAHLASQWRDLHVVLVGDGPTRHSLEVLSRNLGLADRVHFAGLQPNRPNLHRIFHLSVHCSVSEGASNSVLEAMAAGRAVIASAVGGTPDLVLDGDTGLLIPPGDHVALAAAIGRLLRNDTLRARLGSAGRRRVQSLHSAREVIGGLMELYEDLVLRRSGRGQR